MPDSWEMDAVRGNRHAAAYMLQAGLASSLISFGKDAAVDFCWKRGSAAQSPEKRGVRGILLHVLPSRRP